RPGPGGPRRARRLPASARPGDGRAHDPEGGTVRPPRVLVVPPAPAVPGPAPTAVPGSAALSLRGGQGATREGRERPERTPAPDRAAFTMAGAWMVVNTVEETTYAAYQHLRLVFRLVIRQQGETFEAEGEKYLENGQALPAAARSPITIRGT